MREGHPIDERFKALYDAEATPPEAVHEALAAHLGWNTGAVPSGGWKPMLWAASALVVIGVGIGVWMRGDTTVAGQVAAVGSKERSGSHSTAPSHGTEARAPIPSNNVNGASGPDTSIDGGVVSPLPVGDGSITQHAVPSTADAGRRGVSRGISSGTTSGSRGFDVPANEAGSGSPGTTALAERSSVAGPGVPTVIGANTNMVVLPIDAPTHGSDVALTNNFSIAVADVAHRVDEVQADRLVAIPQPRIEMGAGTPITRAITSDYVLPHGCWWVGAYAGIGTVNGQWRGDDATALSDAETWRSTAQGGVLFGREWHTGWSLSGGVGVARVRSTFRHETPGALQEFTNVDTMWVENSIQDIPVYTWMIDSLVEVRPGASLRSNARNEYTAVQVPLNVAWHADARRLRYGAFGGVTAWIPTQRKGLTLVQVGPDAGLAATNLADARVNERFGAQLHGQLGLSLGYFITEHFSAYAEPMISAPLVSFDGHDTPWLTRPLLQIRLQHALCSRSR